tara:strand:+ start:242 stop:343 length:102 start_codon:yes stop_codon:yes gene_type:complete
MIWFHIYAITVILLLGVAVFLLWGIGEGIYNKK